MLSRDDEKIIRDTIEMVKSLVNVYNNYASSNRIIFKEYSISLGRDYIYIKRPEGITINTPTGKFIPSDTLAFFSEIESIKKEYDEAVKRFNDLMDTIKNVTAKMVEYALAESEG
jgi:hypothetical protein